MIPPAGEGIPSKKLSFQDGSSSELILNLASLKATHTTYVKQTNHPNLSRYCKFQKYIIKAGATPKLITSPKESNSLPILDVPLINLAIRPSNASINPANNIAIIATVNFPSIANFIEVNPMQTPIKVIALGRIILVFLSDTIIWQNYPWF